MRLAMVLMLAACHDPPKSPKSDDDGLPFHYYTVKAGAPAPLLPGFAIAAQTEVGDTVVSQKGVRVRREHLTPVVAPRFRGIHLLDGKLPLLVHHSDAGTIRVTPEKTGAPQEIKRSERWIDVDLSEQTLVAYEGERPVFATLVSTGTGPIGSALATPVGAFRIYSKLATADMDNVEHVGVKGYYSVEAVPNVQYFAPGKALHGTFWHDRFGHRQSHGCINLSPADAAWLYSFTRGPSEKQLGTLVRVR